jgi:tripartite-type tricarboxylate transporter receptor subunit TctC
MNPSLLRHSTARLARQAGAALLATALLLPAAHADTWPSRPLKLIVPFPPGGAADAVGRIDAEKLSEVLKQPIVIDNKPGAGSAIGGDIAAKAAPDGYTLSLAPAGQLTVVPHIQKPLAYDPLKDFAPVTTLAQVAYVIAAHPSVAATDLAGLVRLAKKRLADLGLDTLNSTPAQFAALIRSDHAKWGEIIARNGIRGD